MYSHAALKTKGFPCINHHASGDRYHRSPFSCFEYQQCVSVSSVSMLDLFSLSFYLLQTAHRKFPLFSDIFFLGPFILVFAVSLFFPRIHMEIVVRKPDAPSPPVTGNGNASKVRTPSFFRYVGGGFFLTVSNLFVFEIERVSGPHKIL